MNKTYIMNTNETKAKIWNMCIEKGTFNKVKGEDFKKIQEIFEQIVKAYEQIEPSPEVFNKIIDSISLEIQNQNKTIASFETIQKEYNQLLNTPVPQKIDFTVEKTPITPMPMSQIKLEDIIMTQNKILIQILETQVKIIEALKK